MCNTCHTNYNGGCYGVTTQATANTSNCFGCGQRICRDCCGNVWVRRNTCGCAQTCHSCCQQNCCQNGGSASGNNGGNGGGNYGCFTICGRIFNTAQTNTNATTQSTQTMGCDSYYARQYGLYPYGGRSYCCGSGVMDN